VAAKYARFGIFVGSANSLEIMGNRLTLTPAGFVRIPQADGIRVVGYLGPKAVIRQNYTTGFAMGIRAVPLTGNGPGTRAPLGKDGLYTERIFPGNLWLIADNAIQGASTAPSPGPFWTTADGAVSLYIDAPSCLLVNNLFS
jgi:hypothetical protein